VTRSSRRVNGSPCGDHARDVAALRPPTRLGRTSSGWSNLVKADVTRTCSRWAPANGDPEVGHRPCNLSSSYRRSSERGDEMKRFAIATLLVLVALGGAGTAWAFNDDTPLTGPDSIQAP